MEGDKIELVEAPTYADVLRENVNKVLALLEEAKQAGKSGVSIAVNCTEADISAMLDMIAPVHPNVTLRHTAVTPYDIVLNRQLYFVFEEPVQPPATTGTGEGDTIEHVEAPTYADILRGNVNMVLALLEEATQADKKGVSISANCTDSDVIALINEIKVVYPKIVVKQIRFSSSCVTFKRQLFFLFEEPAQPPAVVGAAAEEAGAGAGADEEALAASTSAQNAEAAGQPTEDHQ
jgi:hypothetical protein